MAGFLNYRTRRIVFVGDSICGRGFALGVFQDELNKNHPLYSFASPVSMANLVLAENALSWRAQSFNISRITQVGLAAALSAFIVSEALTAQDWMIFEDGGDHIEDPDAYQTALESVLTATAGVNRACMTMFDYPPAPSNCQWDRVINGRTTNQAIQAAAAARGVPCIDMNAIMDAYKTAINAADGVNAMLSDGIHPGVWGQMKLTGAVLSTIGLTPAFASRASLTAIASANFASLSYGSGTWTQQKAIDYCVAILG